MRKLLQLNVLIAGGAASIALAATVLVGRRASWIGAAIAFALAFAVYDFDRPVDSSSSTTSRWCSTRRPSSW